MDVPTLGSCPRANCTAAGKIHADGAFFFSVQVHKFDRACWWITSASPSQDTLGFRWLFGSLVGRLTRWSGRARVLGAGGLRSWGAKIGLEFSK